MEYQKISNLLESTSDNSSRFRTRNWVVMPMYNLIEYCDNYSKTSGVYGSNTRTIQMII